MAAREEASLIAIWTVVVGAVACIVGVVLGVSVASMKWREDAIQHEVGEYNQKTGEFQWRQPDVKASE